MTGVTERQKAAIEELRRQLTAFPHNHNPQRKELENNIDIILKSNNGGRAYTLIGNWIKKGEEYLLTHANEY